MLQGMLVQGTTPELTFTLPEGVEAELIKEVRASFIQKEKLVLVKETTDCLLDLENDAIIVNLTQEDTFLFDEYFGPITATLRILCNNDQVVATDEVRLGIRNVEDKVVMS